MSRAVTCLPCGLAKKLHDGGPHECNGKLAILNEATTEFEIVHCICRGEHTNEPDPAPTTPEA